MIFGPDDLKAIRIMLAPLKYLDNLKILNTLINRITLISIKKRIGGQRIIVAACLSVHGISNFNPNRKFSSKSWRMAHDYVERVNLNYPNNLVFVDTTFFRLTNMVHVYFATNPEFILSKSREGSPSEGNPWSKRNITKNDDKNKFMSNAIMIGQNTMNNNIDDFIDGKRLDFFRFNDLIGNK